jgi:hypothetical protein
VKGWHARTFPDEWPSADNKGGIKEDRQPIRRPRSQTQPHTSVRYQQQAGYSLQDVPALSLPRHRQDDFKCTQNGYVRQASTAIIDSRHQHDSLQDQQNGDIPQLPRTAAIDPPYQENIRQDQACGCTPQMPRVSFHSTYKHDSPQYHYHGFVPQMPSGDFDSLYQHGEPFPGLSQNPIDLDNVEDTSCLDGGLLLSMDDQQLNVQDNEAARQPDPASHHQRSNPLQHANHQSVPQLPADPLTIGSRNDRTYSTPNPQQLDCSFEGQHGTLKPSTKHYRTDSIFDNPTPPPQYPLPPAPTTKFEVIHKGHNQKSWRPIVVNGSSMVTVDPDGFPTDHRRKRVKGQPGSETRDSIAIYQLQLNGPNLVPQESPASQAMQSDTTRNPTVNHHVHPSKVSVHSDLRDSGYVSVFNSAFDSIRSSFSSLNLADDVNFKTDYKEADDGFVDVKVKAQWRMRRSFFEKLRDPPINGPSP